ncbi:Modification methylase DpnIIB [Neomoorella glycerini]|uniref:Methyltransferase n=1 Tax=Neomoorella glycerini TaxID=55779 RepID=A0A6I5ZNK4_9FIRM|nr:site-specific DNA-methyltransferase [Moorella glycerini]QGP91534.1 Modification methylase DpnIIB [Moorella glycerini]
MVLIDRPEIANYSLPEITNRVILGNALEVLKKLPAEAVDTVFLDPPYFLQLPKKELRRWKVNTVVAGVDDDWDKFGSFAEYDEFIYRILTEIKRVMKPQATIWVIATYHSIFRIGKIMQDLGYWILNDVIWAKTNPMPNWLGVRFTNATETLIWAVKDRSAKKYTFNKKVAKEFGIGKVAANIWVLPICNGTERVKDGKGKKLHSTQKPVELLRRIILTSTREGDVVLDPMAGVGTTGYVAQALKRNFIMIEINPKYVEGIKRRFQQPWQLTLPSGQNLINQT